jgi:hypothetical protein
MHLEVQANSWQRHAEGELALMKARGPRKYARGFAHQLFLDGRLNIVSIDILKMREFAAHM